MSGEIERHDDGAPRLVRQDPVRLEVEREERAAPVQQWRSLRDGTGNDRACPPPRKAGELDPEWVMCGVDVPAGKRLYASKDLKGSAFAVAMDQYGNGDGWHLTTTMCHMLVITKPTYGECLAELMRIWRNWENEGRELPTGAMGRRAL
jgi:hypothetical protein